MYKVKRSRKVRLLTIDEVAAIVGLSAQHIRKLEKQGKFPKRHSPVGRLRWSKLVVWAWYNRWGPRSERRKQS